MDPHIHQQKFQTILSIMSGWPPIFRNTKEILNNTSFPPSCDRHPYYFHGCEHHQMVINHCSKELAIMCNKLPVYSQPLLSFLLHEEISKPNQTFIDIILVNTHGQKYDSNIKKCWKLRINSVLKYKGFFKYIVSPQGWKI